MRAVAQREGIDAKNAFVEPIEKVEARLTTVSGTTFYVHPKQQLVVIMMMQVPPAASSSYRHAVRYLVYQAMTNLN
jgi:CubicO group peptidase (beta-lactamase class C family)